MKKQNKSTITVKGAAVSVLSQGADDFISLTDIAKFKNADHSDDVIRNWLRNRNTVEFLGVWERLNHPGFKPVEFDGIRIQTGLNSFTLTPKQWIEKEFQRLKEDENQRLSLAWNLNRTLSKLNYRIHTDAVKQHLIPPEVTPAQAAITYANEADLLNVALFGQTAKQWRDSNPDMNGNMRDYAGIEQLLVLANIEGVNAEFIHMKLPQSDRLKRLNAMAIRQMQTLTEPLAAELETRNPA